MRRLLLFSILSATLLCFVSLSKLQHSDVNQVRENVAKLSEVPTVERDSVESKTTKEKTEVHLAPELAEASEPTESLSELEQCMAKLQPMMKSEADFIEQNKESLSKVVGSWYFGTQSSSDDVPVETSKAGRFLQALAQSGLLEGRRLPQDESHALNLLYQVMDEDPENSAPILYASVIEKKRGNDEAYAELMERLGQTRRYDSYVREFSSALFSNVQDPRDYFAVVGLWSRTPFPNMREIRSVMEGLQSASLAEQFMKDGLEAGSRFMELSWSPLEYGIGYGLMRSLGLERSYPHPRELMAKAVDAVSELQNKLQGGSDCQLEDLLPMIESQRTDSLRAGVRSP